MNIEEPAYLFAYGTLQTETVQLATFGRRLEGQGDALVGYRLMMVEIKDQDFVATTGSAQHRSLQHTGLASDSVTGTVFAVTQQELELSDAYEPVDYKRALVQLRSGVKAWLYMQIGQ